MFISKNLKFFVIVLAVTSIHTTVFAIPQFPHIFYGNITIDGNPAPIGTVVVAKIGGVEKGKITTTQSGKYGGPNAYDAKLLVQGSDLSEGDTINFTFSGINASETVLFESGTVANKNLTFVTVVDGSSANVTLTSTASGQADLPSGITSIQLSDTTSLDVSNSVNSVSNGIIAIGGVNKTLNNFTSGNLSGIDLSVAQIIGGQSMIVNKAVVLQSGIANQPFTLTNNDLSNVTVTIPDATTVLAPSGWNGTIMPPKVGSNSGTAPSGFSVGSAVISVGSPDVVLIFDTPIILKLTGVTGAVGYKPARSSAWVSIDTNCSGNYTNPGNPIFLASVK